jgi:biopolymer transport protein ExbD
MADKQRQLDVWIVETNTVYRDVPFTVVTDWIQQGRLLPEDRARPAGKGQWYTLGAIPAFGAYFPKPEPDRVEDRAEALEPVEGEFSWRRRSDQEEDDPDMIPLIDVTLVLLIFFMMTAAVQAGLFTPIDTPPAQHQLATISQGALWVGIDRDKKGELRHSLGRDNNEIQPPGPSIDPVLQALRRELKDASGEVKVRIRADKTLMIDTIRDTMERLQEVGRDLNAERVKSGSARLNLIVTGEVSEPQ